MPLVKFCVGLCLCLGLSGAVWAGPVRAEGPVCVLNAYEVAWVHPGITFYLDEEEATCAGESLTLKESEQGCFAIEEVDYDGSWQLSALDATTAKCLHICDVIRPETRIVFSNSRGYACQEYGLLVP